MTRIISVINDQEKFQGSNSFMLALKFVFVTNVAIERPYSKSDYVLNVFVFNLHGARHGPLFNVIGWVCNF